MEERREGGKEGGSIEEIFQAWSVINMSAGRV